MAQLILTIPDAQVDRVRAAFAHRLGVDVADVTAETVRTELVGIVKRVVRQAEVEQARDAAGAGITDVDAT